MVLGRPAGCGGLTSQQKKEGKKKEGRIFPFIRAVCWLQEPMEGKGGREGKEKKKEKKTDFRPAI